VRTCEVRWEGKDGKIYAETVEPISLFDAVDKGTSQWNKTWIWDPNAKVTVQSGSDTWVVTPRAMQAWRERGRKR
jgi:hypothetical protein